MNTHIMLYRSLTSKFGFIWDHAHTHSEIQTQETEMDTQNPALIFFYIISSYNSVEEFNIEKLK